MTLRDVLEGFASGTTMHGVPKVINARSTMGRCFWSVVCIAAGSMFCMQMSEVLHRYFAYPKKVTVEVVPSPVPFPAISLCNMRNLDIYILNTLNRKFIEKPHPIAHINTSSHPFIKEYMKTAAKYGPLWYDYQEEYPIVFSELFSRTTFSANIPKDIISLAAVQLDEFIVNCYFGSNNCNRSRDFTRFFDPYYFNCFTYNAPGGENQLALSEGIENGWSSIVFSGSGMLDRNSDIRVLPGLHEYRSAVAASEGVRVVIHPPGTQPFPFTEGFDVPPGFSASFGIRPRRIKRIGPPHGNCSKIHHFEPDDSGNDERTNGDEFSNPHYRTMACQKMCLQRYITSECGCKDISLPDVPGTNVMPCRDNEDFPDDCMFNATEECLDILLKLYDRIQCTRQTKDGLTRNATLMSQCQCFPPCDEISYDVSYSLSKWPASGYEGDAAFYDVFYIELFRERFKNTPKYNMVMNYFQDDRREETMKDFARLNAYIADSNVIITQEMEDYTSTQLVSDIGGQLGLWVGISIITLAEVLELICDFFRHVCSTKRRASREYRERRRDHALRVTSKNHCNNIYVSALDQTDGSTTMILTGRNGDSALR